MVKHHESASPPSGEGGAGLPADELVKCVALLRFVSVLLNTSGCYPQPRTREERVALSQRNA